jgi:hypothetical protein
MRKCISSPWPWNNGDTAWCVARFFGRKKNWPMLLSLLHNVHPCGNWLGNTCFVSRGVRCAYLCKTQSQIQVGPSNQQTRGPEQPFKTMIFPKCFLGESKGKHMVNI